MKIAVVNNFYPPRAGGSAHMAEELALQYKRQGHDVLVMTAMYSNSPTSETTEAGVNVVRLPAWKLPQNRFSGNFDIGFTISPKSFKRVKTILDDFEPDIIHQHGQFFDLTWQTGIWARKNKVPSVLSIHTRLESPLSRFNNAVYKIADRILVAPLMRLHKPKLVIMDKLMAEYAASRYKVCFSGTINIPVGIDLRSIADGDAQRGRKMLGLNSDPLLLSVGHVIPQRSRIALVKALPEVLRAIPNLKLAIIGGVHHREFLEVAEHLGVRSSIITPGAIPKSNMPDLYAAANAEVHELDGYGFGTACIEALASGTPVVATVDRDNFIDFDLVDGEHLFTVPYEKDGNSVKIDSTALANILVEVLRDSTLAREKVSQNARKLAISHFSSQAVANRHLKFFETLL